MIKKKIGLILAAGRQTRFNSETPKALVKYGESTALEHNIGVLKPNVDEIYVVCSTYNYDLFKQYGSDNIIVKSIDGGLGCGHGVMKALELIKGYADIVLIWGDSIQNEQVVSKLVNVYRGYFLVPVVEENKPYVQFKESNKFITKVSFSKFNDKIDDIGYHDLSIFAFDKELVLKKLKEMHKKYWKDEEYNTRSKELVFLDLFNENKRFGKILKFKDIEDRSFNTVEEYNKLIEG